MCNVTIWCYNDDFVARLIDLVENVFIIFIVKYAKKINYKNCKSDIHP